MRKAMLSVVAATFAMTGGLLAMTPQSQPDPKQTVTVTGCVQNESDVLKSSMPKTGMTDEFVLTHSMIHTGTSAAQTAPAQPQPSATAENKIYRVTGDQETSLKAHLGQKVEIAGTFKSESDARTELGAIGTSGKPPATAAEPTATNTPEITINSIKPTGESCTAK